MRVEEFREIIKQRIYVEEISHGEWQDGIEECWKKEIEILSEDVSSTIEFLENECTADEYSWISEVLDDLAEKTKNTELILCYRRLMDKFPEECEIYNIISSIESAEKILEG